MQLQPTEAPASDIVLRPYQIDCLEAVKDKVSAGGRRGAISLPTAGGKTIIFSHLAEFLGLSKLDRILVLAHRDELVEQARDKYLRVNPGEMVGIEKADSRAGPMDRMVVASVQTLHKRRREEFFERWGRPKLVITDECFPAGTLVDGIPIEEIKVGDRVTAFDEKRGAVVLGKVTHRFVRTPEDIIRLCAGGREIICTPNHPFWTRQGWQPAGALFRGEEVALLGLHRVPDVDSAADQDAAGLVEPLRAGVLQPGVLEGTNGASVFRANGADESQVRFGSDEGPKSNIQVGRPGEDIGFAATDRSQALGPRRKRQAALAAATDAGRSLGMADRSGGADEQEARLGMAAALQNRYSERGRDDCGGSGRRVALHQERPRREKDGPVEFVRVASIEVLEPGSDGRFGGVCPDGQVYNLEVDGVHTYTANGFIVHNCHHATAETYRAIYEHLDIKPGGDIIHIGCTATLRRSDRVGLDAVYDEVWYSIGIADLIGLGFLAKLRGFRVQTGTDISSVGTTAGDFNQGQLAEAVNNERRNAQIVHDTLKLAPLAKAIVFAASVEHSQELAERFTLAGHPAAHIDGTTDKLERRQTVADFHANKYRFLTNFGVFTEGFDEPSVDTIVLARPTKSPLLYAQMIGRGTRIFEGKEFCTVIDFVDVSKKHSVVTLPSLLGMPPNVNLHGRDAMKVAAQWRSLADESPLVAAQITEPDLIDRLVAMPPAQRAAAFMKALIEEAQRSKTYIPVDMLKPPEMPEHVRYDYNWVNMGESYRLSIPALAPPPRKEGERVASVPQMHIVVEPGELGTFQVRFNNDATGDHFASTVVHNRLQHALDEAEGLARRHVPDRLGAVYRWAKWRKEAATPGQIFALRRARIAIKPGLTKGEANDILNQVMGKA
jgi:superfamily II DNA or RNA helicase